MKKTVKSRKGIVVQTFLLGCEIEGISQIQYEVSPLESICRTCWQLIQPDKERVRITEFNSCGFKGVLHHKKCFPKGRILHILKRALEIYQIRELRAMENVEIIEQYIQDLSRR